MKLRRHRLGGTEEGEIMSTQSQPASQEELVPFLEKLAQFHATLSPREQSILDEMTAMALVPPSSEVQGYTLTAVPSLGPSILGATPSSKYYYYYRGVQQQFNNLVAQ
jgi:hypothetical protein